MLLSSKRISSENGHDEARILLAELYRQHTGSDMPPILTTPLGKPYFENGPFFSITHTKNHVFCVLSERPVGIDAEEVDRDINLQLADKILSPAEKTRYNASPDKRLALLRLWVLKEADAKRTGKGIQYPNYTDFSPDDPRVTVRDGCLLAIIEEEDHVI